MSEVEGEASDQLNAFLTSSLNIELVYTILKGIRGVSVSDFECPLNPNNKTVMQKKEVDVDYGDAF